MDHYNCNTCGNCRKINRPDETVGKKKLQQYCFYCMHKSFRSGARKIGHLASWTGRTPTWCPVKEDDLNG